MIAQPIRRFHRQSARCGRRGGSKWSQCRGAQAARTDHKNRLAKRVRRNPHKNFGWGPRRAGRAL